MAHFAICSFTNHSSGDCFGRCTLSVLYVWLLITPLVSSNVFVNYCDYNVFTHQLHLLLIYLLIYGFISSLRNFVNVFSLIFSDPIRSFIHPEWSQLDYLNKILFNLNRKIIYYRKCIWTKEIISISYNVAKLIEDFQNILQW